MTRANIVMRYKTEKTCLVLIIALLALSLVCCQIRKPAPSVKTEEAPSWSRSNSLVATQTAPILDDDLELSSLAQALERSIAYFSNARDNLQFGEAHIPASALIAKYQTLLTQIKAASADKNAFYNSVSTNFAFMKSVDSKSLMTGYYEPLLQGSRTRSQRFNYPLYRQPDDLLELQVANFLDISKFPNFPRVLRARVDTKHKLVPYYSRQEIDSHSVLKNRNLELCWVEDQIDAFFLHIQGSGVVALPDNKELVVNYVNTNGRAYRAIGTELVKQGHLQVAEVNMHSIKDFLRAHPTQRDQILNSNPSYIFFKEGQSGARGSIGQLLTAERSIATDQSLLPAGALAFIVSELPIFDEKGKIIGSRPVKRFVVNQDTGGAIKGPSRVDLFFGRGGAAELSASHMKNSVELYFLVPKV